MPDPTDTLDRLRRENASLDDVLRLRWFHWAAMLVSFALAVVAWNAASGVSRDKEQRRFEHEAGLVADAVAWRTERTGALDAASLAGIMHGALDPARRLVGVAIRRGDEAVYDDGLAARRRGARDSLRVPLERLGDGAWSLELWSTPRLERRARRYLPHAILAGGLGVEALLFALFVAQSRGARRTLALAAVTTSLSAELADRGAELQRMNAELERFACTASHDLRAPLQGMLMQLELVELELDEGTGDEAALRARLARIHDQIRRLQRLIDDVLAYGAADADVAEASEVDVRALVREIGDALHVDPARLHVEADPPVLRTDAARLGQVLSNLVSNAFKYHDVPERATVRVACEPAYGGMDGESGGGTTPVVTFRVEDDGPGIAEADHERVFEMFARLPGTGAEGSGVGLAIVRRAVEAVGGALRLDSSAGAGARFSFTWPAAAVETPAQGVPPGETALARAA